MKSASGFVSFTRFAFDIHKSFIVAFKAPQIVHKEESMCTRLSVYLGLSMLAVCISLGLTVPVIASGQGVSLGVGAELAGEWLQGVAAARFGSIGIQGGAAVVSKTESIGQASLTLSGAYVSLLLKYYIGLGDWPVSAYIGAGGVGVAVDLSANGTSLFNGIVGGTQGIAGVEFRVLSFPLALYGGATYVNWSEVEVTILGIKTKVPIAESGIMFHVGVRIDFTIGGSPQKKL